MTDRVFQDGQVSEQGRYVEVYAFDPETSDRYQDEVMITLVEDDIERIGDDFRWSDLDK